MVCQASVLKVTHLPSIIRNKCIVYTWDYVKVSFNSFIYLFIPDGFMNPKCSQWVVICYYQYFFPCLNRLRVRQWHPLMLWLLHLLVCLPRSLGAPFLTGWTRCPSSFCMFLVQHWVLPFLQWGLVSFNENLHYLLSPGIRCGHYYWAGIFL